VSVISALRANTLRSQAIHCAIELRAELVAHARAKFDLLGLDQIELRHGSCLGLDPQTSMRFERIYIGAGAEESMAVLLFHMLELGGVLVGPFSGPLGSQRLLRVVRLGESAFQVRELMSVHFTPLLPTPPQPDAGGAGELSDPTAAPAHTTPHASSPDPAPQTHVPSSATLGATSSASGAASAGSGRPRTTSISLAPPEWSVASHDRFPATHRAAVRTVLLVHRRSTSLLSYLPKEMILQELLPKLAYTAFATQRSVSAEDSDRVHGKPLAAAAFAFPAFATTTNTLANDDDDDDNDDESNDGSEDGDENGDSDENDVHMDAGAPAPLLVQ